MTWTKLSDDFSDDIWTLSDAAARLHVDGLCWSNRKLLDGRISKLRMDIWTKHPEAVAELVAVGFWDDDGDCYRIVHHLEYQRTREEVVRRQKSSAANGARGGRPRKPPREIANPVGSSPVNPEVNPVGLSKPRNSPDENLDGQARPGQEVLPEAKTENLAPVEWVTVPIPNSTTGAVLDYCNVCGGPLTEPAPREVAICGKSDSRHDAAKAEAGMDVA